MVMKSFHSHLVSGNGRNFLTIFGGISFQFGLGFNIWRHGLSVDIGPLWFGIEW